MSTLVRFLSTSGSHIHVVFTALTNITREHSCSEYTVLNDVATALYGLVKPLEEVRYLVSSDRAESLVHTILKAHGVSEHHAEVREKLREQGLVAVSTVFYPLLVVETARGPLERELISRSQLVSIGEYKLCAPRLEHLIVKLISMKLYPYSLYGYTLFFTWLSSGRINVELLVDLLRTSGVSVEDVARSVEEMHDHLVLFKPHEFDKSQLEYFKNLLFSVK